MGARGPKPVDRQQLQGNATSWATMLYTLRDGQSGHMQHVKWGPLRNTGSTKWTSMQAGRGNVVVPAHTRYRSGEALSPAILIPVSDAARKLPVQMKAKGWVIFRPTMPDPEAWELLKRARSVQEVHQASRRIRRWMTKQLRGSGRWLPGYPAVEFTDVLDQQAEALLTGKKLPGYAKSDRPTSDDKRIEFISKILAGARFRLAPITAAKRLSHWHWRRDWAESSLKEYIEWSKQTFANRQVTTQKPQTA